MKKLKWLITGASGFIGQQVTTYLAQRHDVIGTSFKNSSQNSFISKQLNVLNQPQVLEVVSEVKPDVVIHLAGAKDVNWCEENSDKAYKLNCEGTRNIAEACLSEKAFLIFMSTDHIFDGIEGDYRASSLCTPRTIYGQTKLQAERIIIESSVPAAIVRTGGVYCEVNPEQSFLGAACVNLKKNKPVVAYTNLFNSPTFMEDLLKSIEMLGLEGLSGIFHLSGPEKESRYSFLCLFAEAFQFRRDLIIAEEYKNEDSLKRPLDVSLNSHPFYKLLNMQFLTAKEGLQKAGANYIHS